VKRLIAVLAVLTMVLGASLAAGAVSVDGDVSYLIGLGQQKGQGFAAHAQVEVMKDIFADASFVSASFKDGEEKGPSDTLLTIGGLYRVANEEDLQIFVGGGYAMLTHKHDEVAAVDTTDEADKGQGQGLFGKFGFKLIPAPKFTLFADVAFAPKLKLGEGSKTLTTARATVAYEVMENISVQGTVKHYRVSDSDITSGILVGGGVSVTF